MALTSDEQREAIFREVLDYAKAFGFKDDDGKCRLANSEALFQNDDMQIDALNLVGDLLNILNGKS